MSLIFSRNFPKINRAVFDCPNYSQIASRPRVYHRILMEDPVTSEMPRLVTGRDGDALWKIDTEEEYLEDK